MRRPSRLRRLCGDLCFCCVAWATDLCHACLNCLERQRQRRRERRFQKDLLDSFLKTTDEGEGGGGPRAVQEALFFFP